MIHGAHLKRGCAASKHACAFSFNTRVRLLSPQVLALSAVEARTSPTLHQQPDVNYIQILEKVDFPCTVHAQRVPFKGNQVRAETGYIVHFWLLVVVHDQRQTCVCVCVRVYGRD